MQPTDYKVFQNYIFPLIKKLMDTTKFCGQDHSDSVNNSQREDVSVRHAIAKNLALITKVGIRCIEIA